MRQAGTLPTAESAQRFVDYLLSQGISAKSDADGHAFAIWIRDEDQLPRALAELSQFAADPNADRYAQATQQAQLLRKQQQRVEQQRVKNIIEVRDRFDLRPSGRRPLTITLIVICVAVFLGTSGGTSNENGLLAKLWFNLPDPENPIARMISGWTPTQQINKGEVWRLVTPIFIHYGPMHLVFNLLALYSLGSLLEVRRGPFVYGMIMLVTAIVSNYCQYYIPYHFSWAGQPETQFGGMSGVIFGIFGYLWIKSRFDPTAGFFLPSNTVTMAFIWLALCFTGLLGPVANWAHLGGLVTGSAIAYAPVAWRKLI